MLLYGFLYLAIVGGIMTAAVTRWQKLNMQILSAVKQYVNADVAFRFIVSYHFDIIKGMGLPPPLWLNIQL